VNENESFFPLKSEFLRKNNCEDKSVCYLKVFGEKIALKNP